MPHVSTRMNHICHICKIFYVYGTRVIIYCTRMPYMHSFMCCKSLQLWQTNSGICVFICEMRITIVSHTALQISLDRNVKMLQHQNYICSATDDDACSPMNAIEPFFLKITYCAKLPCVDDIGRHGWCSSSCVPK